MKQKKVWFVTGASKGLGLVLVKQLVGKGFQVAATSRVAAALTRELGLHDNLLSLEVDLTNEESVRNAVEATISKFGTIDVVVNNAGYGLLGGLEELSDREARENFDINVFGSLNVIRATLPQMRKQKAGHIINIASIGGYTGMFAGFGIYCATKFAVHGFTESLSAEIKDFGIHATVVSPGYFRTNFLAGDSLVTSKNPIDAYAKVREMQTMHQQAINGQQPGDPEKGATAIITLAESATPPLHLFLGQDAFDMAHQKIAIVETDLENWKDVTIGTGY